MKLLVCTLLLWSSLTLGETKTLKYGESDEQTLDFTAPKPQAPLVIYVHGGAWISGSKDAYQGLVKTLNEAGFATAILNYRLSGGESKLRHPQHAKDVALAIDWLSLKAPELGFDPQNVFLVGHSAGAHIAAVIATNPSFAATAKHLSGFVGYEGIYDLPALSKKWPTYRDWFLTIAFGPDKTWKAASPQFAKPTTKAPWLLVHSEKDELVDTAQTTAFAKHLKAAKVPVQTDLTSRLSHFGVIQSLEQPASPLFRSLKAFLLNPR